jgi:hypothetical protein
MTDLVFMSIWILISSLIRQIENGNGNSDNEPDEEGSSSSDDGGGGADNDDNETQANMTEGGGGGVGEGGKGVEGLDIDQVEFEPFEPVTQAIKIGIAAFSLLLLGLSVSAYRKTHLKRLVYAAVAFGLFALQMFVDYLEDAVPAFDTPYSDMIFFGITLAILVLFFVAIVRRK